MRHVVRMTFAAAVGLMAIFAVDLLSLVYISWLGDPHLTAGIGFSTAMLFLMLSVNIGLMISTGALVSRAIGAGDSDGARRLASTSLAISAAITALVGIAMMIATPSLLTLFGATGKAHEVATRFLMIVLPSNILMGVGMTLSAILRAAGDARRAMFVTLGGGIATAIADPILIFGMNLGVDGAAIATVLSRVVFVGIGAWGVLKAHDLLRRITLADVMRDFSPQFTIAAPAILTNLASPIANALVLRIIAPFGESYIAGAAIIDRLVPVLFGVMFALSGAVGPIFGQNLGAGRLDRVRRAFLDALIFVVIYSAAAWALAFALQGPIVSLFSATGATAEFVRFFCLISGLIWGPLGLLFVANAVFNNLGFPLYSTMFNWGRATLGTLPFAAVGAQYFGPNAALLGLALGALVFGGAALITAYRLIAQLADRARPKPIAPQRPAA